MYDYNHIKNFKMRYYMWKNRTGVLDVQSGQSSRCTRFKVGHWVPTLLIVSIPLSTGGRSKHISTIFQKGVGVWRVLFGEGLDAKWVVNIWRGCKTFRDSSYKFNFSTLIWPIIYLETEKSITCYFSHIYIVSFFYFITSFFVLFY